MSGTVSPHDDGCGMWRADAPSGHFALFHTREAALAWLDDGPDASPEPQAPATAPDTPSPVSQGGPEAQNGAQGVEGEALRYALAEALYLDSARKSGVERYPAWGDMAPALRRPWLEDIDALLPLVAVPPDTAQTLLRALTWCGHAITDEQREQAWAWVEQHTPDDEEMGT